MLFILTGRLGHNASTMATLYKRTSKSVWIILLGLSTVFLKINDVHSVSPGSFNRSELEKYIREETQVADEILKGYDKRFVPTLPGIPLHIKLQIVVADVLKIADMEADMIIFIRQTWYDCRLTWNSTRRLKIREHFLDKIWLPDIRIVNLKDVKRFEGFGGVNMNIYPDGRIYFSQLVHVTTSCPMDLHNFPMDRQTCFLKFSSFAYSNTVLNFSTSGKDVQVRQHELPQFDLVEAKEVTEDNTGIMSKFTVALTFQRRAGYYILQVYIPSSFLVILSWLAFFMEPTNIADRLALEITMILSSVFLLDGINDSVTRVSYAKASDWFVIISFGFIFVALLETMLVYRLSLSEEATQAKKVEERSIVNSLRKQLSITFMNTEDEVKENVDGKFKQQAVVRDGPDGEMYISPKESDIAINNSENRICCQVSRCIDKISIFLFPTLFIGFNIGYWKHYWP